MLMISRPFGRRTRLISASAVAGSTAAWHSTSAAITAPNVAVANGSSLTLPHAIALPDRAAAVAAAGVEHGLQAVRQRVEQTGVQGAIPPHPVLDRGHACVFVGFHAGGGVRALRGINQGWRVLGGGWLVPGEPARERARRSPAV